MLGMVPTFEMMMKKTDSVNGKRIWEHFIEGMYSKLMQTVKIYSIHKYINLEKNITSCPPSQPSFHLTIPTS